MRFPSAILVLVLVNYKQARTDRQEWINFAPWSSPNEPNYKGVTSTNFTSINLKLLLCEGRREAECSHPPSLCVPESPRVIVTMSMDVSNEAVTHSCSEQTEMFLFARNKTACPWAELLWK